MNLKQIIITTDSTDVKRIILNKAEDVRDDSYY